MRPAPGSVIGRAWRALLTDPVTGVRLSRAEMVLLCWDLLRAGFLVYVLIVLGLALGAGQ